MISFLKYTAEYILAKHSSDFQNVVILMPNRRSCLYLERELASLIKETSWLPQIISLSDWLQSNSSLNKIDKLLAIIKLYNSFQKVYPEKKLSLDEFYFTGQILLNDFNDIDSECIDAKKLFVNLQDLKEISDKFAFDEEFFKILSHYIHLFEKDLSKTETDENPNIQSYIKIWQGLFELYSTFRNDLISEKQAYDGLLIRYFIENDFDKLKNISHETFYIVGFNALSRAEEQLFNKLQTKTHVSFLWEYDDEYIKNEQYSAGLYLRNLMERFPLPKDFNISVSNFGEADIKMAAFPNEISQAKFATSLLKNVHEHTAMVLADESLLPVVLNSLPDNVDKVNITMGFPIKQTATYTLIKQLFKLRQQIRKGTETIWLPRNIWMELLYHPFLCEDSFVQNQINFLIKNNSNSFAYLNLNSEIVIKNSDDSVLSMLKDICLDTTNTAFLNSLLKLLSYFEANLMQKDQKITENQLEIQAIRKVYNAFTTFSDLIKVNHIEVESTKLFIQLLNQILQDQKIDLFGEPLEGLQIMGLMESRLLDFEKVLVLSLNDEVIPGDKFTPTFILYSLRKFFGLSTPEKREAIDAFHFYRLLQRSKQVYLFYSQFIGNEEADKSPYLRQLLFNSKWKINEKIYNDKIGQSPQKNIIEINKKSLGEKWNHFLQTINEKGLSQNAISSFIQCPLKFYFERVEKLTDEDLFPDESLEKDFGLLFHEAIERLFRNKKFLNKEDLKEMQLQIPETVEQIFQEKFPYSWAQVLLLKEQLKSLLHKFFETERQDNSHFPCEIISVEEDWVTYVKNIKLYGRVDMIIKNNSGYYVIDFKTGSEKEVSFKKVDDLFDQNSDLIYAFQLAFYGFLYLKKDLNINHLYAENIYIKTYDKAFKKVLSQKVKNERQKKIQKENIDFTTIFGAFEQKIDEKLNELLDVNEYFTQTSDINNCKYCNFNLICRKK